MSLSFLSPLGEFQFAQVERKLLLNIASLEKYSYFNNRDPTQFITYILLFPIIHLYFNELIQRVIKVSTISLRNTFPITISLGARIEGKKNRRTMRSVAGQATSVPRRLILSADNGESEECRTRRLHSTNRIHRPTVPLLFSHTKDPRTGERERKISKAIGGRPTATRTFEREHRLSSA